MNKEGTDDMMSFVRKRLTYANGALTAALVFAMAGGAYAAGGGAVGSAAGHKHHGHHASVAKTKGKGHHAKHKGYVVSSTKQIKPSVLKSLTGAQGPQGPAGAPGPEGKPGANGANGKAGANGTNGTNGVNGVGVKSVEFSGKEGSCEFGGSAFTSATGVTYACNGKEGSPGPKGAAGESVTNIPLKAGEPGEPGEKCPEGGSEFRVGAGGAATYACNGTSGSGGSVFPLPSGSTETGMWSVGEGSVKQGGDEVALIPFAVPLSKPPKEVFFIKAAGENEAKCPGKYTEPKAAPGVLCVYLTYLEENAAEEETKYVSAVMPSTAGAWLRFTKIKESEAYGFWAVTAE